MALLGWLRDDRRPSASFLGGCSKQAEGRKDNMFFVFNGLLLAPQ